MNIFRAFMELDEAYNDRQYFIDELKKAGKNYNFSKYTDAQLYRMCQRLSKVAKTAKDPQHELDLDFNEKEIEYCDCGARLSDAGFCPVCHDGEEDLIETISTSKMFVELEAFRRDWKKNGLTDEDLRELQNLIMQNPDSAIPLGAGLNKIRFIPSRFNRGKNSLFRVFYIEIIKVDKIYLAAVLNKNDDANISDEELSILKTIAKKLEIGVTK